MSEPLSPIAVTAAQAAAMLSMPHTTFYRWVPKLKARGLKCVRGRYMVDSLRASFAKACDEHSGNVIRRRRANKDEPTGDRR